ncbi:MAG: hypothetical protein PHU25_04775 [Deltaproteobacteria bacterium]|nr:hypothetical protein [Deltaproteobacteria bacterium]
MTASAAFARAILAACLPLAALAGCYHVGPLASRDAGPAGSGDGTDLDDSGAPPVAASCSPDGWQLVNPPLGPEDFIAVAGGGPDEILVLSSKDAFLRFDGKTWRRERSGLGLGFGSHSDMGLWRAGPDDDYAVSGSALFRFDGKTWTFLEIAPDTVLADIWGSGPNDIYAVGSEGTILRFNGSGWRKIEVAGVGLHDLNGVFGTGADDVHVVGDHVVARFDGQGWSVLEIDADLRAVWASGPGDAWAVGSRCAIWRNDGHGWNAVDPALTCGEETDEYILFKSVWGSGPGDIWIAGSYGVVLHRDGESWSRAELPERGQGDLTAIWGAGPHDVYAVGDTGRLLHFDGSSWRDINGFAVTELVSAWSPGRDVVVAGQTNGGVLRIDGGRISVLSTPAKDTVTGLWGAGGAVAHGVTAAGDVLRFESGTWRTALATDDPEAGLARIHGRGADDVWAVGARRRMLHYDGGSWNALALGMAFLEDVSVPSSDAAYAVGKGGVIWTYDGAMWSEVRSYGTSEDDLSAVFATSGDEAFAVGKNGAILRFDGQDWTAMPSPTDTWLQAVWASAPDDVFAGGDASTILHYDGISWQQMDAVFSFDYGPGFVVTSLWGTGRGSVYAVGHVCWIVGDGEPPPACGTMILHYDGVSWAKVLEWSGPAPDGGAAGLWAVSGRGENDVVAVGYFYDEPEDGGTAEGRAWIRRFDGTAWTDVDIGMDLVLTDVAWTQEGYRAVGRKPGRPSADFGSVVLRHDGAAWVVEANVDALLRSLDGAPVGPIFAVGDHGRIARWDRDSWQTMVNGAICDRITDVWAPPEGPVAASCEEGGLLVGDGFEWTDVLGDSGYRLQSVWTDGAGRLFAAGEDGAILGYDSGAWTSMASGISEDVNDIWGPSPSDLWAVGHLGAIVRFDGTSWRPQDPGLTGYTLNAISGNDAGEIYAVGPLGLVLKHPCDAR